MIANRKTRLSSSTRASRVLAVLAAFVAVTLPLSAAVRLTYVIADQPKAIAWMAGSFPIKYVVDQNSPLLQDRIVEVEKGFEVWAQAPNTSVKFARQPSRVSPAGRDNVNTIAASDVMFRDNGFIAFTTTWFDTKTGAIQEADIQVDPVALQNATLRSVIQHEAGHFLGLDHGANLSSVMYPYLAGEAEELSTDERLAMSSIYPAANQLVASSSISGEVRAPSGPLFGAQVVAIDAHGAPIASALSHQDGSFSLSLPPGSYRIYVEPLDGPVDRNNLSGVYQKLNSVFRSSFLESGNVQVNAGQRVTGIVLNVDTLDPLLNPKWIGITPANSLDVQLAARPVTVRAGEAVTVAVGGDGIVGGMTTFEVSGDVAKRTSEFRYGPNYVSATFEMRRDAEGTPLVVIVSNGNETAMLTGALRIQKAPGRRRPVGG